MTARKSVRKLKLPREDLSKVNSLKGGRAMDGAFTRAIRARILEALRAGNYIHIACESSGVSRVTFYEWMKRGRIGEEPYATFRREVAEAIASAERDGLENVQRHSKLAWQATAWMLERRWPKRWGRRLPTGGGNTGFALPEGTSTEDAISVTEAYLASLKSQLRSA